MPDPNRAHSIYETNKADRAYRYASSKAANTSFRPNHLDGMNVGDRGTLFWVDTYGGWSVWNTGSWRFPNGADGWKDG